MKKILSDKKIILLFILPALLLFSFIVILPICRSVWYSSLEWDGIGRGRFAGWKNYAGLITGAGGRFPRALWNSVLLALLSVGVQLPLAFILARILAGGVRGEGFFRSVYFIPVIISTVVIGQMWLKIYNPQYGLLNNFLEQIGWESMKREWIGAKETALAAVFIPLIWQYIGYHTLLFYAGIKTVPKEILEAAQIDGAGPWKSTIHVLIPNILPIIEICVILAVIGSLKTFDLIYVITGGGPLHATEVPTILMFNTIFHRMNYGGGSAMAIVIIAECLLFTLLIQRFFKRINAEE